jgi:hypothetical protein
LKRNYKNNLDAILSSDNTTIEDNKADSEIIHEDTIILNKKTVERKNIRKFTTYMDKELQQKLDKVAKISGYSRNELLNIIVEYYVNNVKVK